MAKEARSAPIEFQIFSSGCAVVLGVIAFLFLAGERATATIQAGFDFLTVAASAGTASVLTALKVSSWIAAIPLMVCIVISILSFLRWIKEHQPHLDKETAPETCE